MQKIIAKIYLKNIYENARIFKARTGKKLCAVVKADAYGHGAAEVTSALTGVADLFAVALLDEAKDIRVAACGKDILILTPPTTLAETVAAVRGGFILTVSGEHAARLALKASEVCHKSARVHLKVNTGMNRYGMGVSELGRVCCLFKREQGVSVEGIYSHLYDASEKSALAQREKFKQAAKICRRYFPNVERHLSATLGALRGEKFAFDCVRIGLGLYGYLPDGAEKFGVSEQSLGLRKALEVFAPVALSRKYSCGSAGYGKRARLKGVKELCVLRFGYADGFLRKRNNGVCGWQRQVNNLCMDACIRQGRTARGTLVPVLTDAKATARQADTIVYEVLCAATRRAERVYIYD